MLGLDDRAAGIGDADLGREHIEIGRDAGGLANFVLLEKRGSKFEAAFLHGEIFPGVSQIEVSGLRVMDDREDAALVVQQCDADAELVAFDIRPGDFRAGALEQGLAQADRGAAAESGI